MGVGGIVIEFVGVCCGVGYVVDLEEFDGLVDCYVCDGGGGFCSNFVLVELIVVVVVEVELDVFGGFDCVGGVRCVG